MVNVAVIGIGRMGHVHARNIKKHHVKNAVLTAVCDIKEDVLDNFCKKYGKVATYTDYKEMLEKEKIDAVVIATEHYFHVEIAKYCVEKGVHILVEKPVGVTTKSAKELIELSNQHIEIVAAIMYNQRTNPLYARAKKLVDGGFLGELNRVEYIITNWYRSQAYYDQGNWRASWWGEGGGTLINQCIHQLDLVQWIVGMPIAVNAKMFTKNRKITTENDVIAQFELPNSVFCSFIASTHELRGTNRLEISGTKGRIVIDSGVMKFYSFNKDELEVNATTKFGYGFSIRKTKTYKYRLRFLLRMILGQQINILRNFVDAIENKTALISPIADGINALEIINGMYLSNWTKKEISLPIDDEDYQEMLTSKIEEEKIVLKEKKR
ncbi:MAG: Gfo/Idh/MocA family oxidoreductase [Clostridia bacterium]